MILFAASAFWVFIARIWVFWCAIWVYLKSLNGSPSVVLFASILLSYLKTINAKVFSFLTYILNTVIKKLYNFVAW